MGRNNTPSGRPAAGLCAFAAAVALSAATDAAAAQYILGPADSLAIDQPRITFGLTDESTSPATLIGPTLQNLALLDTGANGVLLAGLAYADGEDYGQPAFPFDYDGDGTIEPNEQLAQYAELGVAGTSLLDIHDVHGFRIVDSAGVERLVDPALRAFGDDQLNIGSFAAIVGMPAMAGYAVEIDLRPTLSLAFQDVFFHDQPADAGFESAASMNVDLRIIEPEFTDPTLPPALRPTFAGLPVVDHVDMVHTGGGNSGGATLAAEDYSFLMDTGAQTVIISEQMATDMGLDFTNPFGAGGDVVDFLEVGGIGGTVAMPLVVVDQFIMPTQGGTDLVYTDLIVGVLDIDGAPFDAVFGMNLLTTGYLAAAFGGGGGTQITNPLVDEEDVIFFIDVGTVSTVQDLIAFDVIRVTEDELQELIDVGLITNADDPLEVYNQLSAIEDLVSSPASGALFDKVVFDFTPTDGTATMRLDFNAVQVTADANYDGVVNDSDIGIVISNFASTVQPGLQTAGDLNGDGLVNDTDLGLVISNFAATPLPGDTDGDGDIDDTDLGNAIANFTGPVGNAGGKTPAQGDTDGDGDVDDTDLGNAIAGFTGPLAPATVPEPASVALLGMSGLLLARRRRAC